jgi:hypothetical protein
MLKQLVAFLFLMTVIAPSQNRQAETGVLGISGANWEQGGVKGVEVVDISHDSSAGIAGLSVGDPLMAL